MLLQPTELSILCQTAISAAYQAGHLITSYQGKKIHIEKKNAGDSLAAQVLTEVDKLSQEIILHSLAATCQQFDLALLSEESPDDHQRFEKDYFWCIDPMDGTLPFIESRPGYSVSIALVGRDGTPVIGVIYDPITSNLYHAIKGIGAFRNSRTWKLPSPSHRSSQPIFNLIIDRPLREKSYYSALLTEIEQLAREKGYQGVAVSGDGGAAMNACWVLESAPACYFKFPKPQNGGGSLWDFSASACIFHALEAWASDFYGQPLALNQTESTFMNQRGVFFASDGSMLAGIQKIIPVLQPD